MTKDNYDDWNEAGGGTGKTWDAKEPIVGVYVRKQENVGPNNSNMYHLQVEGEDETTGVWGSTVLDNKFSEIPLNSKVRVEFLGTQKSQRGGGSYKDYSVKYKVPDSSWADDAKAAVDKADAAKQDVEIEDVE